MSRAQEQALRETWDMNPEPEKNELKTSYVLETVEGNGYMWDTMNGDSWLNFNGQLMDRVDAE